MTAPSVGVVIVAAGRGLRAGGDIPKQYRSISGKPLLRHTIEALMSGGLAPDRLQIVYNPTDQALYDTAVSDLGLAPPVTGGATRQESVHAGLEALSAAVSPDIVLIHDAARPFVSPDLIDRIIAFARRGDGAIPGLAVTDTLKRAGEHVEATVPRDNLYAVQTPQGFPFAPILAAHRAYKGQSLTDDAAVAEKAGVKVCIVAGNKENFKVTQPEDFALAERRLADLAALGDIRLGTGFDVHQFEAGDHVWICGLRIEHDAALKGHSDADVGLHAITDAILGALGDGDIGEHFPPTDPNWKGAASDRFLAHAVSLVRARGGDIAHLDVTLICERPKIGPHKRAMAERIAGICELETQRVSVKATTTEGLGFTGRREGIAAQAAATIRLPF